MKNLLLILGTLLIATPFVLLCLYALSVLRVESGLHFFIFCACLTIMGLEFLNDYLDRF
jgi:hypothetical protein